MWRRLLQASCSKQLFPISSSRRSFGCISTVRMSEVKGMIGGKAPIKVMCQEGKTYSWCACGLSAKQPLCDGSHQRSALGITPFQWTSSATKEYFFCTCKQTNTKPLCDGSHKKL